MPQNNPDLKIETPEKQAVAGKPMRRGWILTALVMTLILAAMDNTIESTATPQIVGDLGGFSLFSWVFSVCLFRASAPHSVATLILQLSGFYGQK